MTTPVGEGAEAVLMESLLEGMAQYYSENLARNVRRGLEGNALKGVWASGHVPLGYTLDAQKHLILDPVGADTVKLIFRLYSEGMPRAQIIRKLNAEHRQTSYKRPFIASSVDSILTNPLYTGVYKYGSVTLQNACPVIIEQSLFDKVQQVRHENGKARARHTEKSADYLLTGKLLCGCCGAWMIGMSGVSRTGKPYYYYACSKKSHNKGGCKKQNEPRDAVENAAIASIKTTLTDKTIVAIAQVAADKFAKEADNSAEIKQAQTELTSITKRINNLLTAVEQGVISDNLQARLTDLEEQQRSATEALERAKIPRPVPTAAEIGYYLKTLRDTDPTDPEFRKTLVNHLLNSMTIYDTTTEDKKIAVAYNLTQAATETLDVSSINNRVGLVQQSPNHLPFYLIKKCAVFMRSVVW